MHGIFEWLLAAFIGALGFVLYKWAPLKKIRYVFYCVIFLVAFIFDLNNFSFASDNLTALFYFAVLTGMTEFVWLCGARKNRYLLGFGLVVFVPIFIYIYTAMLMITPFPCHEHKNVVVNKYTCESEFYVLNKAPALDLFEPGYAYTLCRLIPRYHIKKKIDKYVTPEEYYNAYINPKYQCIADRVKIDLYVDDNYVLWSLVGDTAVKK